MRRRRLVLLVVALVLPVALSARPAGAQIALLPGSTVRIDGTSSVDDFTCTARADRDGRVVQRGDGTRGVLILPVAAFDCGHGRINRDFRRALRAADHPEIRFALEATTVRPAQGPSGADFAVEADGRITLAGHERPVRVTVRVEQGPDDTTWTARGAHALRMTDFGIDPPTALFGLVRTHDEIVVRFDLRADLRPPLSVR